METTKKKYSPPSWPMGRIRGRIASLAMVAFVGLMALGLWSMLSQAQPGSLVPGPSAALFSREQAIAKATEEARLSDPGLGIQEARIDGAEAELMTLGEADKRQGSTRGPGGYPSGTDVGSPVWWVTVKGYFRYAGTPFAGKPVNGVAENVYPIYEASERYFIYYAQTGERNSSGVPHARQIGPAAPTFEAGPVATRPAPMPAPPVGQEASVEYQNDQYGFSFALPDSWKGYTVQVVQWAGDTPGPQGVVTVEEGPMISIRHPRWTTEKPRQDIPIMVFTLAQWSSLQKGEFHIGAAPMNPKELGRNGRYVFALPARYNYAFPEGFEEVERILEGQPLRTFEPSTAPANTTVFAFPYEAWPTLDRADLEKCLARKDYTVDVHALTPSGERRVGGIGMSAECGDEVF